MTLPEHRKLGWDHLIEMREITARLEARGLTGIDLYFGAIREYEATHANDPTFRERQAAWLTTYACASPPDLLRLALEEIRDGHNNPRELARKVLEQSK